MAAVTPPGFTLKSVPRANGTGGGLAVLFRNSLVDCVKVSIKDLAFKSFEVCETRLCYQDQSVMFLCVYRPPPSRKNKLSNKMFLDEFPDLLESYVSCDRRFVLGDINFHFDSNSDASVTDLKKLLRSLSLQQLINVPTHRRGHILDWLTTNRDVDIEELCFVDKLFSDHFVISFALRFRKPGKTTKQVRWRNVRALNTESFRTDVLSVFSAVSGSADRASAYNACLRELLDKHAPLVTRRVTDRTSVPWTILQIKQGKQQRPCAERQWHKSSLEVHRQIYAHCRNVVNRLIRKAKKLFLCEKMSVPILPRNCFA